MSAAKATPPVHTPLLNFINKFKYSWLAPGKHTANNNFRERGPARRNRVNFIYYDKQDENKRRIRKRVRETQLFRYSSGKKGK